jgi:hypothetical protein
VGRISLYAADRLCCHSLRIHPSAVWGSAWFALDDAAAVVDTGAHAAA